MIIQGSLDYEWRRLYRAAKKAGAASRQEAIPETQHNIPVLLWYQEGRRYDTVFTIKRDGTPWPGRAKGSADYACL